MDIVLFREGRSAHVETRPAGDGAFAHLRIDERDMQARHEVGQGAGQVGPARRRPEHDQGPLGPSDERRRPVQGRAVGDGQVDRMRRHGRQVRARLGGDILRKFEMDRSEPLLLRNAKRLAHHRRDGERTGDLAGHLGQRSHGRDDVHHLEPRLLAAQDPLLTGDHHHGHGAEQSVSGAGGQVQGARPERREANSRPAGQPPVRRGHEGGGLLMARQHQFDRRAAQRLDEIKVFFSGDPEDLSHAFVLERRHHEFCAVHRPCSPGWTSTKSSNRGYRICSTRRLPPPPLQQARSRA